MAEKLILHHDDNWEMPEELKNLTDEELDDLIAESEMRVFGKLVTRKPKDKELKVG